MKRRLADFAVFALLAVPMAAQPPQRAIADLPACNEEMHYAALWVTDAANSEDCTVGGGAERVWCRCNGQWAPMLLQGEPGPQGPAGPPGIQGEPGPAGSSGAGLAVGLCTIWSGTLATIPAGWQLADGSNGTPDLRDRFPRGAAAGQNGGATGGAATHQHDYSQVINHQHNVTVNDTGHSHGQSIRNSGTAGTAGTQGASTANNATAGTTASGTTGISASTANPAGGVATGTTVAGSTLPPYLTVLWVCRTA